MAPLPRRGAALDAAAAAAAALKRSRDAVYSRPELLSLIFEHLPPVEQVLTVSRLSCEWYDWSAPRTADLWEERQGAPHQQRLYATSPVESAPPAWALMEAWPELSKSQRRAAFVRAAFHGDFDSLWQLCFHSTTALEDHAWVAVAAAARGGHLPMLRLLCNSGCPLHAEACAAAARGGHLEVMQFLRSRGCPWNTDACSAAAERGDLEMLQFLRANGCPWDAWTTYRAAAGGNLEVMRFLAPNDCPWHKHALTAAVKGGHIPMLQLLRADGWPWDEGACAAAAGADRLEVLQFLHANGCPWGSRVHRAALVGGHLRVLRWAHANGKKCSEDACGIAARYGHSHVLRWLHDDVGYPFGRETWVAAALHGQMEVLQWMRANGHPMVLSAEDVDALSQRCSPSVCLWLKHQQALQQALE